MNLNAPFRLSMAYLPPISWCAALWNSPDIEIEACEHYQKGSFRNRCHIAGPNGMQRLSIPLAKGKNQQMPIREVRISYDETWQRLHWRSIKTAYGSAPFFEHYAPELQRFYEKKYEFLFDYNLELLHFALKKKMGWNGEIKLSTAYSTAIPATLTPPFEPGRYPQVFEDKHGFLPDLSLLDLLFCYGKRGGEILENSRKISG